MKKSTYLILFFCPFLAHSDLGHFEPSRFRAERASLKLEMDRYVQEGNFQPDGSKVSLPQGHEFQAYDLAVNFGYDFDERIYGFFQTELSFTESYDVQFRRNSRSFKNVKLGGAYKLIGFNPVMLNIEALGNITLDKNDINEDRVSTGDGVNYLQAGVWAGLRLPPYFKVWTYLGYKHRFGGLSKLYLLSIRPQMSFHDFRFGLGFEAFGTVIDDSLSDNPTDRLLVTSRYNAKSFKYYSVNPSGLEAQLWVGYRFFPYTEIKFGYAKDLSGKNYGRGSRVFLLFESSARWIKGGFNFPYKNLRAKRLKKNKKSREFLLRDSSKK